MSCVCERARVCERRWHRINHNDNGLPIYLYSHGALCDARRRRRLRFLFLLSVIFLWCFWDIPKIDIFYHKKIQIDVVDARACVCV